MNLSAMWVMLGVLAVLAVAYRYYSAFLAARVAALDDSRMTPAHTFNDGQNFHPTNRWVLFGHHFAAISGAGPLIGPVLAIQFGYLPGLIWLVVGVCLAGAVQDMMVLAASVRRGGKSLAGIAREEIGPVAGGATAVAILYVIIIALAGLGIVVVKALGGEEVPMAAGTSLRCPAGATIDEDLHDGRPTRPPTASRPARPTGSARATGDTLTFHEAFELAVPPGLNSMRPRRTRTGWSCPRAPGGSCRAARGGRSRSPARSRSRCSSAGTCTGSARGRSSRRRPRRRRPCWRRRSPGRGSPARAWSRTSCSPASETIYAIAAYGFVASVLPVWLLLCPRDYLSSFLKIGTIALLVVGRDRWRTRSSQAPAINTQFAWGGGPYFNGPIFPYVFICIMCGAISGFHALVSSGTTPEDGGQGVATSG